MYYDPTYFRFFFFFFNDTATTEIYTLSLTDALGIDAAALAFRIVSHGRARRRGRRRAPPDRGGEIRARHGDDARAELVAQGPRLHLRDLPGREVGELERAERHADQAVDLKPEVTEHVLHLAVLALPDREGEPHVAALRAIDRSLDRTIADAVDGDAGAQRLELILPDAAVRAHAITAQPTGRRQLERARERAVVGEQQQTLGVEVETADADEARQPRGQGGEDGRTAAGIGVRRQQPARLVVEEEPRALAHGQRLPVDRDAVVGRDIARGEAMTAPLTATRPAAIHVSASRREHSPARAIALAMRSPDAGRSSCPRICLMVGLAAHVAA